MKDSNGPIIQDLPKQAKDDRGALYPYVAGDINGNGRTNSGGIGGKTYPSPRLAAEAEAGTFDPAHTATA